MTKGHGVWEELSVSITPSNPWVVVELSSKAKNVSGSYVKFDEVAIMAAK